MDEVCPALACMHAALPSMSLARRPLSRMQDAGVHCAHTLLPTTRLHHTSTPRSPLPAARPHTPRCPPSPIHTCTVPHPVLCPSTPILAPCPPPPAQVHTATEAVSGSFKKLGASLSSLTGRRGSIGRGNGEGSGGEERTPQVVSMLLPGCSCLAPGHGLSRGRAMAAATPNSPGMYSSGGTPCSAVCEPSRRGLLRGAAADQHAPHHDRRRAVCCRGTVGTVPTAAAAPVGRCRRVAPALLGGKEVRCAGQCGDVQGRDGGNNSGAHHQRGSWPAGRPPPPPCASRMPRAAGLPAQDMHRGPRRCCSWRCACCTSRCCTVLYCSAAAPGLFLLPSCGAGCWRAGSLRHQLLPLLMEQQTQLVRCTPLLLLLLLSGPERHPAAAAPAPGLRRSVAAAAVAATAARAWQARPLHRRHRCRRRIAAAVAAAAGPAAHTAGPPLQAGRLLVQLPLPPPGWQRRRQARPQAPAFQHLLPD